MSYSFPNHHLDQISPRVIRLRDNRIAVSVFCSSFTTVVVSSDNTLWVMGVDEQTSSVTMTFQQVLVPFEYEDPNYKNLTNEQLHALPEFSKPFVVSPGATVKKGYYSVAVISACRERVYEVAIKNSIARLYEVELNPRAEGKIVDFSTGFRHSLIVTHLPAEPPNPPNESDRQR
jgi:hypothetical protein